jgi:hypothetical protein
MGEKCIMNLGLKGRDHSEDRWEDNIRMNLREIGWEGMDRMRLAEYREFLN